MPTEDDLISSKDQCKIQILWTFFFTHITRRAELQESSNSKSSKKRKNKKNSHTSHRPTEELMHLCFIIEDPRSQSILVIPTRIFITNRKSTKREIEQMMKLNGRSRQMNAGSSQIYQSMRKWYDQISVA